MSIAAKCGLAFALVPRVRSRKPIVRRTVCPLTCPSTSSPALSWWRRCQFLADRDRARAAQPLLDIELLLRLEISQLKGAKRRHWSGCRSRAGRDIRPGKAGRVTNPLTIGVPALTPVCCATMGKISSGRVPGRGADLELRLARDDIDARLESAVRAVVRDLDREVEGDAERDGRDVQASRATGAARDSAARASEKGGDIAGSNLRWFGGWAAR